MTTNSTLEFLNQLKDEINEPLVNNWREDFQEFQFRQFIYLGRDLSRMSEDLRQKYWIEIESLFDVRPSYIFMEVTKSLYSTLIDYCPDRLREKFNQRIWPLKLEVRHGL